MKELYLLREVFLLAILFAAAVSDIRSRTVPNVLAAASLPIGLAFSILAPQKSDPYFMTCLLAVLLFLLLFWSRGKLGGGDVKLAILVAFLQPAKDGLWLIAVSGLISLTIGLLVLVTRKSTEIPLAPGMFLAAVLRIIIKGGTI